MCTNEINAQHVDFNLISFCGLSLNSPKELIIQQMGEPDKFFEPDYECGFLSAVTQNKEFYTLEYPNIRFTGNEDVNYFIDFLKFENVPSMILNYGEYILNCETDLSMLTEIFGKDAFKGFKKDPNGGVIIYRENADDGIRLEIKNGNLLSFKYWTPC